MDGIERRTEARVGWKGSVRLVIPSGDPVDATIADISEMGCGLRTDRTVKPGAAVGIDGTGFHGSGVIRYCYPHDGGVPGGGGTAAGLIRRRRNAILDLTST